LLRSIEWTTFSENTFITALEQANVILRYFLGIPFSLSADLMTFADSDRDSAAGRIQLAQSLLDLLPSELTSIPEPEENATEYLHYRQFFVIWDTLASVVECQSQNVPALDRERKAVWLNRYRVR
jgi:nuclear pore complex protein Nup107